MFRYILAILCLSSFLFSANGLKNVNRTAMSNYFPQNLGDEHVYRKTGRLARNSGWTDKITAQDGDYFQHSNYWGDELPHLLSTNQNGEVREKSGESSLLWYKLSNSQNESWTMNLTEGGPPCTDGAKLKIVGTETVSVAAGNFENCVKIEFEHGCMDAGIIAQWFAPNVGLVKQTESSFAGPITSELVSAKIGDSVYPAK
ncbi:MAG: hypothetical protein JNN15_13555 [Blastocatellia bacterium]|nr:hypothetical protein [Blastocatellia bacterium]